MIYLFIFIYLLFLSIHYDILENKKYKWTHFKIVITLLILVAGLRWRVGSDTVLYAQEFYQCHDLFHLEWADFETVGRMPLWVLLNAACKTVWNDFLLVQFVVAAFSIGVTGYFIKKVCPSLSFFVLLCYCLGAHYTLMHIELLRESVAVCFYLLGILAVNEKKNKQALLFCLLAVMFHVFAIVSIVIFVICYYLLPQNAILRLFFCFMLLLLTLLNNDFVVSLVENSVGLYSVNEELSSIVLVYATSDRLGNADKSIINYMGLIVQFFAYLFMLYKIRNISLNYILLKRYLFDTGVFVCIVLLCVRYSFAIAYRVAVDYNYFFTCFLSVVFTKVMLIDKIRNEQRIFVYFILLLVPFFLSCRIYWGEDQLYENNRFYSRYYPYSSIFDRNFNFEREKLHQLRGGGYSKENDY